MPAPPLKWETASAKNGDIVIDFDMPGDRHILIAPADVIARRFPGKTFGFVTPTRVDIPWVEAAADRAWDDPDRLRELREVRTGEALFQLWLQDSDFG